MIQGWHHVPIWIGLGSFKRSFPYDSQFGCFFLYCWNCRWSKSWNRCTTGRQWSGPPGNQNPLTICKVQPKKIRHSMWCFFWHLTKPLHSKQHFSLHIQVDLQLYIKKEALEEKRKLISKHNPSRFWPARLHRSQVYYQMSWGVTFAVMGGRARLTANKGFVTSNPSLHKGHLQ